MRKLKRAARSNFAQPREESVEPNSVAARIVRWQAQHGRHHLPWQNTPDAYRIWLSEIMLQQTQVATVIDYYERFLARFPDLKSLAHAAEDDVLAVWSGLGYYSRARNLHRAARVIVEQHGGAFPRELATIEQLPGIGRSTAAAIAVFAFGARAAILDGNVKRVLARYFAIDGAVTEPGVTKSLWSRAEALLPARDIEAYTQGLMDLGATLCTRRAPRCLLCPLMQTCKARRSGNAEAFPRPRESRALPRKRTTMLMIVRAGEILLEKRPPSGIWGGLWSFPEAASVSDATALCAQRFGLQVRHLPAWPPIQHGFTHFHLTITPQPFAVERELAVANEPGFVWLTLAEAPQAAVPKPVKDLLKQLIERDR